MVACSKCGVEINCADPNPRTCDACSPVSLEDMSPLMQEQRGLVAGFVRHLMSKYDEFHKTGDWSPRRGSFARHVEAVVLAAHMEATLKNKQMVNDILNSVNNALKTALESNTYKNDLDVACRALSDAIVDPVQQEAVDMLLRRRRERMDAEASKKGN